VYLLSQEINLQVSESKGHPCILLVTFFLQKSFYVPINQTITEWYNLECLRWYLVAPCPCWTWWWTTECRHQRQPFPASSELFRSAVHKEYLNIKRYIMWITKTLLKVVGVGIFTVVYVSQVLWFYTIWTFQYFYKKSKTRVNKINFHIAVIASY
jgi:hypothetical protein